MAALRSLAFAQTVARGAPRLRVRGSRMLFGSSQRLQRQAPRAQQQPTYGDVFGVQGDIRDKPITPEDTARMRAVESATVGQTVKGGTAAKMQSAMDKAGVKTGRAETDVDDIGLPSSPLPTLDEVGRPGPEGFVQVEPELAEVLAGETEEPITIGEALEAAAENIGDKPIEPRDVRVIQSAESRATGNTPGVKRVVAAEAQAALDHNTATVHDVLSNASEKMEMDKVVTKEDAARVQAAERRSSPTGQVEAGGIAATLQSAAERNIAVGVAPKDGSGGRISHNQ